MAACISSGYYSAGTPRPKLQSPKSFKPSQLHYFLNPRFLIPSQPTKIRALTSARFRCCRTTHVVRACSAESEYLPTDVRRRAMYGIDSSRTRRVSESTLNSNEAQMALQALAADTIVEMPDEGDVDYVFLKDYPLKLGVKSFRIKIDSFLGKGKMVAATLLKVSFGMSLVASSVVGLTALVLLALMSCFQPCIIRDGFSTLCGGRFIDYVFSLVFGDGDPNQGIEEKRWKMIGQYIALNGGVVTGEELAPYLDPQTTKKMDDDSYMLPVLLRFDGQPKVDEQGNILYHFPSIQNEGNEYIGKRVDSVKQVENFLKEKKWEFSKVDGEKKEFVTVFLIHNLIWITIFDALFKIWRLDILIANLSFMSYIFLPLLRMYAFFVGSFCVIAKFRWFAYRKINAEVVKRNEAREQLAKAIELPDLSLKQKILSARNMAGVWENERLEWDRRFKERWDFKQ